MAKKFGYRKLGEKGSILWLTTTWLPLFLTLTMSLSVLSFAMIVRVKANKICFEAVVGLQRDLRETWLDLEKLNTQARSLRARRLTAEAQLKVALASGQPPLIAGAQAARLLVVAAQMALRAKQQALLQKAHRQRLEARRHAARDLRGLGGGLREGPPQVSLSLAVRPTPPMDLSPDYVPMPEFKKWQAEHVRYRVPLFQGAPRWLLKNLPLPPTQEAECGATLNPDDRSLALSSAKPWSNWP